MKKMGKSVKKFLVKKGGLNVVDWKIVRKFYNQSKCTKSGRCSKNCSRKMRWKDGNK